MASNVKGDIFSLGRVYELSSDNLWSDAKTFGYIVGGYGPGPSDLSNINRIDYANDLSNLPTRSKLVDGNSGLNEMGLSSPSHGYITGGTTPAYPSVFSMTYRMSFANDSLDASHRSYLPNAVREAGGVHTNDYGYWAGGSPGNHTFVQKIDFSNDDVQGNVISYTLRPIASLGTVNSPSHGYFLGGRDPVISNIQRMDFSNDATNASTRGNLSIDADCRQGAGNKNYGYSLGGRNTTPTIITTVERVDFGNDLVSATIRGPLSSIRHRAGATSSNSHGYICGNAAPITSASDRIDFSNDTQISSVRGNAPIPFGGCAGIDGANQNFLRSSVPSNTGRALFAGGYTTPSRTPWTSRTERLDFDTDTGTTSSRGFISEGNATLTGAGNKDYGWWGGGYANPASPARVSSVHRMNIKNDTTNSSSRGPLATETGNQGQAISSESYAWFAGGETPAVDSYTSNIQRIDFSNDSPTASARGDLTGSRYRVAAVASPVYAWIGSGRIVNSPYHISTVDRIDFASDLGTMPSRGPLTVERRLAQAFSNQSYGWFSGGETSTSPVVSYSTIDRIDFSNDTPTASTRGPLVQARSQHMTASNGSSYGWVLGGRSPTNSIVERFDMGNDQATALTRGSMSVETASTNGVSGLKKTLLSNTLPQTGTYSWWGGGRLPAAHSRVSRIDFSNDLSIARSVGPLVSSGGYRGVVGNVNSGWYVGGTPTPTPIVFQCNVERIYYENDLVTAAARTNLNTGRTHPAGFGNANYGWIGGGTAAPVPGDTTSVERINYVNDNFTPIFRGSAALARRHHTGTSTKDYGYFWAGYSGGFLSILDRMDLANDQATMTIRQNIGPGYSIALMSTKDYTWGASGWYPASSSSVKRLDLSNDTSALSSRGDITLSRGYANGAGNNSYGYIVGNLPFGVGESRVDRIEFANDQATATIRGNIPFADYQVYGAANTPIAH